MKLTADEIRRIGAAWPVPGAEDRIVEVDGKIDLDATLASLERGRDSYQAKADESQRAIVAIKAIVARALANGPRPSTATTDDERKAERLAQALLDALLRYDDPEVAAAREAREAEKERRDMAMIEEFYVASGQRSADETLEQTIGKCARRLADLIERDAPAAGSFAAIKQPIPTVDAAGDTELVFGPLPDPAEPRRYLQLRVNTRSGHSTSSQFLGRGTNAELVATLRSAATPAEIVALIEKLAVAPEFGCASCFRAEAEAAWEASRKFTRVAELAAEVHFDIHILACPKCGQHCVSVFTETIDWVGGEDPQTWQVLPLTGDEVTALRADPTESRVESFGTGRRCLRFDYPTAGPKQITWSTGPIRIGRHD